MAPVEPASQNIAATHAAFDLVQWSHFSPLNQAPAQSRLKASRIQNAGRRNSLASLVENSRRAETVGLVPQLGQAA